jgi:hypothetical protein
MLSFILRIFNYIFKSISFVYVLFYCRVFRNFVGNIYQSSDFKLGITSLKRPEIFKTKVDTWNFNGSLSYNYDPHSNYFIHSKFPFFLTRYNFKNFDIKFIWEISRFQHLNHSTDSENKILSEIRRFIKFNPIGFGPNWISAMEVSIRLVNISSLYRVIDRRDLRIESFLKDSFLFIFKNLENHNKYKGNHYVSNLCSLLCFGSFIEINNFNKKIIRFALNELLREIEVQYNDDGSYYENSTYYHLFVTEMICQTAVITKTNGGSKFINLVNDTIGSDFIEDNTKFQKIIGKAIYFGVSISLDDFYPIIGDLDSGRFMYSSKKIDLGTSFSFLIKDRLPSTFTKFTILENSERLNNSSFCRKFKVKKDFLFYKFFEDFGLFVVKGEDFLFTIRTNYNLKKMVHAHEDVGSVCLYLDNNKILWDPGVDNYNRDLINRDKFRLGDAHNNQISELKHYNLKKFEFLALGDFKFNYSVTKHGLSIDLVTKIKNKNLQRSIFITNSFIEISDTPYFNNLNKPKLYSNEYK